MTSTTVLAVNRPNQQQEDQLTELWDDCVRLTANSSIYGSHTFPTTIEQYEEVCDNDYGVTQAMLDEFIDDIRYGHRCRLCASTEDVCETGRCESCEMDLEGN